jgi:hypothetical protein
MGQFIKKKFKEINKITYLIMIFYKFLWKPSWRFVGNKKLIEIILFSKTSCFY